MTREGLQQRICSAVNTWRKQEEQFGCPFRYADEEAALRRLARGQGTEADLRTVEVSNDREEIEDANRRANLRWAL